MSIPFWGFHVSSRYTGSTVTITWWNPAQFIRISGVSSISSIFFLFWPIGLDVSTISSRRPKVFKVTGSTLTDRATMPHSQGSTWVVSTGRRSRWPPLEICPHRKRMPSKCCQRAFLQGVLQEIYRTQKLPKKDFTSFPCVWYECFGICVTWEVPLGSSTENHKQN